MDDEVGIVTAWMRATSLAWCGPEERQPPRAVRTLVRQAGMGWRMASGKTFASRPPALRVVGDVLREVYGLQRDGRRNVPSAGALYALQLAVVPASGGVVHELGTGGELRACTGPELAGDVIRSAVFHQIEGDAVIVVVSAALDAYVERYALRGARYALLEAGHVVQEAIRSATLRGLAGCPLGAFDDEAMRRILGTRLSAMWPIYALALGRPPAKDAGR
jgi:hypothetical protein